MRAAVLRGGDLTIEDMPEPTPGPGQLLVAPIATGICGSDLHFREVMAGLAALDPGAPRTPFVLGHEFVGEIVEVGPPADAPPTALAVGDVVTSLPVVVDGDEVETVGLSARYTGALAELTRVDAARTLALPEGLEPRLGALTEPFAVSLHALGLGADRGPIVVVGVGPVGLGIVAQAALEGRGPIIAIDPSATRRDMAQRLGADVVVEPGTAATELLADQGWTSAPMSGLLETEPERASVFECVGRPDVVAQVLAEAPRHTKVVLAGACGQDTTFNPIGPTLAEIEVAFALGYRPAEFRTAAERLRDHPGMAADLVTSERPLAETEAAFDELAHHPEQLKVLIDPRR